MKQKYKLQSTGTLFTCRVAGRFSLMKPIDKRFFKISVIFSVSTFFRCVCVCIYIYKKNRENKKI